MGKKRAVPSSDFQMLQMKILRRWAREGKAIFRSFNRRAKWRSSALGDVAGVKRNCGRGGCSFQGGERAREGGHTNDCG